MLKGAYFFEPSACVRDIRVLSRIEYAPCAIIIVNYNGSSDTCVCIESLASLVVQPKMIVVVDNGSTDDSCDVIERFWREFSRFQGDSFAVLDASGVPPETARNVFIKSKRNGGFSAGNNIALRALANIDGLECFWLLNNDTIPDPHALSELMRCVAESPNIGLAGSTLVYAGRPDTIQCAGGGWYFPLWGGTRHYLEGKPFPLSEIPRNGPKPLEYICGASMLITAAAFSKLGLLDEDYFLYYEDVEYGLRARRMNFQAVWVAESVVYHKEGASTCPQSDSSRGSKPLLIDFLSIRNRLWLSRKYYPYIFPVVVFSLIGVAIKRLMRNQASRLRIIFIALAHCLKGTMGKPNLRIF
ncbi:glycosyltransferase family 2 protein [Nitratidesulfovibrio sp. SRB-5]|uniref:glycosyltransferase family 2 protein n=1 Tax=Nitratidesulfovibrio sp. SRB-5 TaxID=2872636 RepID=UPI0010259523|nr:glycosyltransferase family 2 protein [Nitratidesulfovibrio sp. SRB-5]RXF78116.1 glycosyltransferase family 2 protein [Desulfovibrio sp. DS-1]